MKFTNKRRAMPLIGTLVLTAAIAGQASAGLIPKLESITAGPGAGQFSYNYDLNYASAVDEPPAGATVERLEAGDFVTLYDIGGFISATAPTGFTVTAQVVGMTAPKTAPDDDATLFNVTLTYTGATITSTDFSFEDLIIVSNVNGIATDDFTSQTTKNSGVTAGTKIGAIGTVAVPAVPEPASLAVLGIGLGAILRRRAKKA